MKQIIQMIFTENGKLKIHKLKLSESNLIPKILKDIFPSKASIFIREVTKEEYDLIFKGS